MFNHFREELRDAAKGDSRVEESLRARNVILIAAAAIAPVTALMWIAILLLWDNVGDPPDLMYDAALLYPLSAVGAAMVSMPLHRRGRFFFASLISALPLLCIAAYFGGAFAWAAGWL